MRLSGWSVEELVLPVSQFLHDFSRLGSVQVLLRLFYGHSKILIGLLHPVNRYKDDNGKLASEVRDRGICSMEGSVLGPIRVPQRVRSFPARMCKSGRESPGPILFEG